MPDTSKKISQLPSITDSGINTSDLFVITDVSESTSSKITFENVTNAVLSDANIEARIGTVREKLNAINVNIPGMGNQLNATGLFYDSAYRDGSYFLNWANVLQKPFIPTDITDLTNTSNFTSFDSAQVKLRVIGTADNGATPITITTDYIDEGNNNLYYTGDRVELKVSAMFGSLFNEYSDTFDGGQVIDSLEDVQGTFQGVSNLQSAVIRISDTSLAKHYFVGNTLRLYGASEEADQINTTPTNVSISVQGQSGFAEGTSSSHRTFAYKFAYFDAKDGHVGQCQSTPLIKSVEYTPDQGSSYLDPLPFFNTNNFIRFTGLSAGDQQGILCYRSIDDGPYKLRAVLGPKDFSGGVWQDYHLFDYTPWGGKDSSDNTYNKITHFSLTAPDAPSRGWVDVPIKSINTTAGYFEITLGDSTAPAQETYLVYVNPNPSTVTIAHNDTSKINESIQSRSVAGNKSVTLNGKTYMASHILLPNDFGIQGTANVTKIKKLAWSGMSGESYDNSVIRTQVSAGAETISLYGIDFDGNITNQYLVNDTNDNSLNFLLDFGVVPADILIDRCRIRNVIGGGIYANSPSLLRITTGEIMNSGVSDVHPFNPLYASDGDGTIITSNRFENFADSVDVSVTTEGMIASNIIKACGSGLFVAGSTFMVSSPNVLIGAANEFLSSPDILNTEYDSINIPLAQFMDNDAYQSDDYVYQENGEPFSLRYTSVGQQGELVYRLNLIQQLVDGSTQPYAIQAGPSVYDTNTSPVQGIPFILNKRYRITAVGTVNWRAIGAKVGMIGEYFTYNGVTVTGSSGTATADDFAGLSSQNPPVIVDVSKTPAERDQGLFKFKITEDDNSKSMLYTGIFSPAQLQQRYDARVAANTVGFPAGSQHIGVAWSASYRNYASLGAIQSGYWLVYQAGADTTIAGGNKTTDDTSLKDSPEYRMIINNPLNLTSGMEIVINAHTNFSAVGASIPGPVYGRISETPASIEGQPNQKSVIVKFYNLLGGGGNGNAADNAGVTSVTAGDLAKGANGTGTINTVDDFVIAQGLIK